MNDPRPALFRALDQMAALVATVQPDQLDRRTPCDDWDVHTLLDHVVGVYRRIVGAPSDTAMAPTSVATDVEVGEHDRTLSELRREIAAGWADDAVLEREIDVPWGRVPGRVVALGFTQELTVHAWDLAVVIGGAESLDPDLAEGCLATARRILPAEERQYVPSFGPVVAVGDEAGPYERLVGWLGRDPAFAVQR